jgi:phosphoglycerate kinase
MKTIKDIDVKDKKVLVREDFNVPISDGKICDDSKIKEALPTINYLREKGAKIILMSDLGNPDGHTIPELRMDIVAQRLEKLINSHVENIDEILGDSTRESISSLVPGEILMVENLGFSGGEYTNNEDFAKGLAALGDIYVDDAFSIADKKYASNVGITKFIPSYAGLFMTAESDKIMDFLKNIDHPFSFLVAGSDVEGKMSVIERFIDITDNILIAGLPSLAFLKAKGHKIGKIDVSSLSVEMAKELLAEAEAQFTNIILPNDLLVAETIHPGASSKYVSSMNIPDNM